MTTDAERLARYDAIVEAHFAWRATRPATRDYDADAMETARKTLAKAGKQIVDALPIRLLSYVYEAR